MKKTLSLLIALCLMLGCISMSAVADEAAKEPVTIAWWFRGNGEQTDTELVNAKINEMLAVYPGLEHVTLELHPFAASDYGTQVTLGLTAGEQIDILNTVGQNLYERVNDGTLRPIDEYMALVPDLAAELPQGMLDYGKVNGVQYIICHQQQAANGRSLAIPTEYIEKGWIDGDKLAGMYNFADPSKMDYNAILDYQEECLKAVREGTGLSNIYLYYLGIGGTSYCSDLYGYFDTVSGYSAAGGFVIDNATHTVMFQDTAPGAKDVYARAAKWYDEGLTYPDPVYVETNNLLSVYKPEYLTNTEVPKMVFEGSNGTGNAQYLTEQATKNAGFPITVYQLSEYYAPLSYAAGGDGITTACQNPEEAMQIIGVMNTKAGTEIYNTVVYGIEGTHWAFNEDGETITTFGYDGSQGGSDYLYSAHKWIMGNTMNAYLNQACTAYTREVINEINYGEGTTFSALTGIVFDTELISTEISQINAIFGEYRKPLEQGVKGVDGWEAYYEEFVSKLNTAGIEGVTAELQSQVDAYLAK